MRKRSTSRPDDRATNAVERPATAQEVYVALLAERVSPALRSLGLTGSGGRYSLASDSHWALIGFQRSRFSDRREVSFTINLLVVSRDDWTALAAGRPEVGDRPHAGTHYGGPVENIRIGKLLPSGEDTWWRIGPRDQIDGIAREIMTSLTDFAVPWLRSRLVAPPA